MPRVLLDRHGRVRGYTMGLVTWLLLRCLAGVLLAAAPFAFLPTWAAVLAVIVVGILTALYVLGRWAQEQRARGLDD